MGQLIDGKSVSLNLREKIRQDVEHFVQQTNVQPSLAVVYVGDDPASAVYVRNKHRACLDVGIRSIEVRLPTQTTESALLEEIARLNARADVHGILVQLPLPAHISESRVIEAISPTKDVDAFHPENVGRIVAGTYDFLPCTPAGIMALLRAYQIDMVGKSCVIVGRSNIVGKPMFHLMLAEHATVTVCHSKTRDLASITRNADILIVAIGRPQMIGADHVKPGAVVIDVGINRTSENKLVGDVDFAAVAPICSHITPVPGGVGPMTITMLLANTLIAAKKQLVD